MGGSSDLASAVLYCQGPHRGRERNGAIFSLAKGTRRVRRCRGWERGFVPLSPFLLRVTFAVGRFSRPFIVRYSCGCELSCRLGWVGSAEVGMLSFTNKHSLNPAEVGRHQGTKQPRAHFVKGGRENHSRGLYGPVTNLPVFVLNEFELSLACPAKEAPILRPRGIQGGSRPPSTASSWQHSGKARTGRRTCSFQSGVPSGKYRHTRRIRTGVRTRWELDAGWSAAPTLLLLLLPPSPAAFLLAAALARLLAGSRREPPARAPPARPRLPLGTAATPARAGTEAPAIGGGGSGCEAGSRSPLSCGFAKSLTRRGG